MGLPRGHPVSGRVLVPDHPVGVLMTRTDKGTKRAHRWIQQAAGPARILEELELDGGWFTSERMAMATGLKLPAAKRALERLRSRGLVESRVRPGSRNLDWRLKGESPMYANPARYPLT